MTIQPLTKRQREVMDFLQKFVREFGFAPSLLEIGAALGVSSLATTHKHLEALKKKGYIQRAWNRSRHLQLIVFEGCCPTCGRKLDNEAKVSIENGRKVCDDKSVEKGAATPIPT